MSDLPDLVNSVHVRVDDWKAESAIAASYDRHFSEG